MRLMQGLAAGMARQRPRTASQRTGAGRSASTSLQLTSTQKVRFLRHTPSHLADDRMWECPHMQPQSVPEQQGMCIHSSVPIAERSMQAATRTTSWQCWRRTRMQSCRRLCTTSAAWARRSRLRSRGRTWPCCLSRTARATTRCRRPHTLQTLQTPPPAAAAMLPATGRAPRCPCSSCWPS